jgi:3D (Asp-Asp-Asp) domain-containing protein
MKTYYGNYLGICISNNDPEKRGRVQVFIPHIMSALYENWNEKDINGNDVDRSFIGLGDNIQNGLPSAVIDKLKKILPWAESASPIIGASSPGTLTQTALAAIGNAVKSVASIFDQSPTANTPPSNGVNVVPNFYTSTAFNNGPVNITYSPNPTDPNTTSTTYGIPTGSLSPNTSVTVSSLPEAPNMTFGSTAYGNADIDKTTANDIATGKITSADQYVGASGTTLQPGISIASNVLPLGSWVQLTNAQGQPLTNPNNSTGLYRVDDTGGAQVNANIDFYAGSDKALYNQLANIGGGTNSGGITATAADGTKIPIPTNLVNKTDPHGPTASFPHNDTAKGMFSYPSPGAMLWVFFQEGNPLFPVYFAANYGAAEWKSAYKYGSPGPGYQPEGTAENPTTSTGGVMNVGPGVMRWEDTNDPKDNTKSQQSLYFGHSDGSNMLFNRGYHQIYSKFDRRDQVDGDRYHSTLGYKEEWVQGDSNSVTMGDVYVKIGNVSQPAVDASTRIQQLMKDIYQPIIAKNQGNV